MSRLNYTRSLADHKSTYFYRLSETLQTEYVSPETGITFRGRLCHMRCVSGKELCIFYLYHTCLLQYTKLIRMQLNSVILFQSITALTSKQPTFMFRYNDWIHNNKAELYWKVLGWHLGWTNRCQHRSFCTCPYSLTTVRVRLYFYHNLISPRN